MPVGQPAPVPTSIMGAAKDGARIVWNMAAPNRGLFDNNFWDHLIGFFVLGWGGTVMTVLIAIFAWKARWTGYTSIGMRRAKNTISLMKWAWDGTFQQLVEEWLSSKLDKVRAIQTVRTIDDAFDWIDNLFKLPQFLEMVTR